MTKKEAKEIMCKVTFYWELGKQTLTQNQINEAIDLAIKALEQQPCEDCVSREAVKKQFEEVVHNNGSATEFLVRLWKLPSVQPTRPTGHWIEKEDYNLDTYYECSECGEDYCIEGDILIHKYCPNCGARMTESEEDNGRKDNDI